MNTSTRHSGFTLIELLAVIAIIGLIGTIGTPAYFRWIATNNTVSAATTLAQEVTRTRTQVKRSDTAITLKVVNGVSAVVSNRTVTLPNVTVSGTLNLTFVPPFGTLATGTLTPQTVTLVSSSNPSVTRQVSVVSLFGKVVVK